MMLGMGDTTTPAATNIVQAPPPSFMDGLSLWKQPSNALKAVGTVLSHPAQSFSGNNLPVAVGILAPPIALVFLLVSMGGKK